MRGLDLSGSWIGDMKCGSEWIVHLKCGSELEQSLSLCVAVRGSELVVLLCVRLFCVSLLSSLCVAVRESDPEMN